MLTINLLGTPWIDREGTTSPGPRGRKAWGLLAYLILSEVREPSREYVAGLLFAEADDPLGSLRWNLSELRRTLGPDVLSPGAMAVRLPVGGLVDVEVLTRGSSQEALSLSGLGRELLEGMNFSGSPAFEAWLLLERRRLIGASEAALHEAALDRLAAGRAAEAADVARRLVELDPYEDSFQELLVRSYAQAGDPEAARRQLASCVDLFRRELDRDPDESVVRAAEEPANALEGNPVSELTGWQVAAALLEAGKAAAHAGATDAALESLRRAAAVAADASEPDLEARALLSLGTALVHAVRGRDEEGASSLLQAAALAIEHDLAEVRAAANRELGYIDVLAGRYARCERRLEEAASVAESNSERAAVEAILGMASADRGAHVAALRHLEHSVDLAERGSDPRRMAFALSFAGRSQLLTDQLGPARASLERALALVEESDWLAFVSWPEAWLAEVELLEGNLEGARRRLEHAFALGCELRDPCWEALAGRGLGLLEEREGDAPSALRRLEDARNRAGRTTDSYLWVQAYALEALAAAAVRAGSRRASEWAEDLCSLAARTGMRELAVKAYLHRAALGDASALDAARVTAAELESPALAALVDDGRRAWA